MREINGFSPKLSSNVQSPGLKEPLLINERQFLYEYLENKNVGDEMNKYTTTTTKSFLSSNDKILRVKL